MLLTGYLAPQPSSSGDHCSHCSDEPSLTWETVVLAVVLVYGFALSLRFIIAPDAAISWRQRRVGEDFGKGEYPSIFERIFGTENPRHVQIFGVVTLLWVAFSALFFVMPLWRS